MSPTRLAFRFLDHWSLIARVAAGIAALYWFTSGIVLIRSDEQALVTRFGRSQKEPLLPGLHALAGPVRTHLSRAHESRAARADWFCAADRTGPQFDSSATIEWTSQHAGADYEVVPGEAW